MLLFHSLLLKVTNTLNGLPQLLNIILMSPLHKKKIQKSPTNNLKQKLQVEDFLQTDWSQK